MAEYLFLFSQPERHLIALVFFKRYWRFAQPAFKNLGQVEHFIVSVSFLFAGKRHFFLTLRERFP